MKVVKYILSVLFILMCIGSLIQGSIASSFISLILGVIFFPTISSKLKENINFWSKKGVRYGSYILLFILIGVFSNEIEKTPANSISKTVEEEPNEVTKNELPKEEKNDIKIFNLDKVYYDADGNKIQPDDDDITFKVVEVLAHKKVNAEQSVTGNFENISLLIEVSNYDKEILRLISFNLKREYAKFAPNNCNLELWDNKKAYQKYIERDKYISKTFDELMAQFKKTRVPFGDKHSKLKEQWDRKNYPFIADHNIVTLSSDGGFTFYPIQDWYYKEIGDRNFKNQIKTNLKVIQVKWTSKYNKDELYGSWMLTQFFNEEEPNKITYIKDKSEEVKELTLTKDTYQTSYPYPHNSKNPIFKNNYLSVITSGEFKDEIYGYTIWINEDRQSIYLKEKYGFIQIFKRKIIEL